MNEFFDYFEDNLEDSVDCLSKLTAFYFYFCFLSLKSDAHWQVPMLSCYLNDIIIIINFLIKLVKLSASVC